MVAAPPAPVLTVLLDANPSPRVVLNFSGLDATAATITVTRIADGEKTIVRGARKAAVAGSFLVVDYEAPFSASVTYQAQLFTASASSPLGATASADLSGVSEVWVSDPLNPLNALRVENTGAALSTVGRKPDMERLPMLGRERPVVQFFGLGALEGVPFHLVTETAADRAAMWLLLDTMPVLIRTPSSEPLYADLPRSLSAALTGSARWPGWVSNTDAREWSLMLDEVAPQTLDVAIRIVTIQTYMNAFPLISDLMGAYATIADEMANPPGGY